MRKAFLISSIVLFGSIANSAELTSQNLRILGKGEPIGTLSMAVSKTSEGMTFTHHSSGSGKWPGGATPKFDVTGKHFVTSDWLWKGSDLSIKRFPKNKISVVVTPTRVSYKSNINNQDTTKSFSYTGKALPRRVFYNYLRTITPPTPLEVQEISLYDEIRFTLEKVQWLYLGSEMYQKKQIQKYEIRAPMSTIIMINQKGELLKIKELDIDVELLK